jgi:hypothetical protein
MLNWLTEVVMGEESGSCSWSREVVGVEGGRLLNVGEWVSEGEVCFPWRLKRDLKPIEGD